MSLPDKLYGVIDGTGVPMTAKEAAGRDGKAEDGRARTREVKLAVFFTHYLDRVIIRAAAGRPGRRWCPGSPRSHNHSCSRKASRLSGGL